MNFRFIPGLSRVVDMTTFEALRDQAFNWSTVFEKMKD